MCLELILGWILRDVKLGSEEELWRRKNKRREIRICGVLVKSEVRAWTLDEIRCNVDWFKCKKIRFCLSFAKTTKSLFVLGFCFVICVLHVLIRFS